MQEPTGSVCTPLTRQTVGGGTLIADSLATPTGETYVAAEAFTGEYKITVEKVWGKPLGGKAQLKIIRHQGTPDETEQLVTLRMNSNIVRADHGQARRRAGGPRRPTCRRRRRTTPLEDVPSAATRQRRGAAQAAAAGRPGGDGHRDARHAAAAWRRRAGRWRGRCRSSAEVAREATGRCTRTRCRRSWPNSVDVTAQAVLSADRRSVRLSVKPVFNTAGRDKPVKVNSPVVPGGPSDK